MSFRRIALHVVVWLSVFVFWLVVTRQHHPTLTIVVCATAVLVSSFALAVYTNSFLWRRFAQQGLWLWYVISLLATVAVLDLMAVLLIQLIYDWLWGADPLRYGFWFNLASDGFGIALHLGAAMVVMWVAKFLRRNASSAQPSEF